MNTTTTDPVRELLERLDGVKSAGQGKWAARCPAHDDGRASLSITTGDDGRALLRCHAGCTVNDICGKLGIKQADLFPPKANGNGRHVAPKIIATYDYRDADGESLYQAVRFTPKDFRQRRPDGKGGWTWNMNGVQRVLYRLPDLLNAFDDRPDDWILIAEGEKDVDRLCREGFTATCNVGGAGKWKDEYSETLRGRRCCIIADKDAPGRKHAQQVAASLHGKAADLRIIECPGDRVKDASDFFDRDGTAAQLLALIDAAPIWMPTAPAPNREQQPSAAEQERDDLRATELRNAELVAQQYRDAIRFNVDRGEWMLWTGSHWKHDDAGYVVNCVKAEARRTRQRLINAGADPKVVEKTAIRMEAATGVAGVEKLLRSEPPLPVVSDALDRDDFALNVLNGTIDLRTGALRQHRRDDLITRVLPIEFRADALAPRWQRFVSEITGEDEELAAYLRRLAGLCASGDTTVQEFYVFHGAGANGKSVFIDAMLHVLGDYGGVAPDSLLMTRRNQEHPTELATLLGKRLVVASETEEGGTLRLQLVKKLTGDDHITARFMRQDFFTFRRTHKLLMVTNNKPRVPESTEAAWRRIRLIPFDMTIPPEKRDAQLLAKLKAEAPGILAWIVNGSIERIAGGMQTPQRVIAATSAYRDESDPLADYAADRLVLGDGLRVVRGDLWTDYESWALQAGEKGALTRERFYSRMRLLMNVRDDEWKRAGQKVRGFVGVGLKAMNGGES